MLIYAIFAHPDDCELWAGGTLWKHVKIGDIVKTFIFYDITEQRKSESITSLDTLGIECSFCQTEPFMTPNIYSFLNKRIEVPDIIITHWNYDSHIEHKSIFNLAIELIHYWNRNKIRNNNGTYPILLMGSTYFLLGENKMFQPNIIIDITTEFKDKINAIKFHKSQKVDLLISDVRSQNILFGNSIQREFAEGFLEYPTFGRFFSANRENLKELIK
ncbi:MAG: PIG-L family deacetylase [Bacteroidales bacterium]|nr:PIG-L family deacetylase [Bacteroidales bacterium]